MKVVVVRGGCLLRGKQGHQEAAKPPKKVVEGKAAMKATTSNGSKVIKPYIMKGLANV